MGRLEDILALCPEPPRRNARDARMAKPIVRRYSRHQSVNDMTYNSMRQVKKFIRLDREDMTLINGIPNEAMPKAERIQLDGITTLEDVIISQAMDEDVRQELAEYKPLKAPSDYWDVRGQQ